MTDADLVLIALFTAWRDDIDAEPFPGEEVIAR